MNSNHAEILKNILIKNSMIKNDPDILTCEDLFISGHLDSFSILNLVQQIEDKFDIAFDYNDVQEKNFKSFSTIQTLLKIKYKL